MESISLADMFWLVLVIAGVTAEVLERRSRRRPGQPAAQRDHEGGRPPAAMGHALPR